jgi:hypothetical protein
VFLHRVSMPSLRIPLLSLIAVLAVLAAPSAAGAAVPRDFVGLTSDDVFAGSTSYRDTNLSSMASVGTGTLRQTFDWSKIETSAGNYDLSYYDAYVATAAAHGIKILPVLFNPPSFRAKGHGGHGTWPPASNAAFAEFAKVIVRRYGRNGTLWSDNPGIPKVAVTAYQVWNEPSLKVYWLPRPSARAYVKMLKAVSKGIKSVDRRAEIVTAGLPNSKLSGSIQVFKYIKQLYKAGGKKYFDTLAFNAYAKNTKDLKKQLKRVRKLMNKARDRRAKIWITEIGWASGGPRHRFNVGPNRQASNISKSFALIRKLRKRYRLRGVVYYSWRDQAPYAPDFKDMWGLHTGLLSQSGSPKKAFYSFKKAVARIR